MDKRLHRINNLLREYSKGNFDKHIGVSARMDEIDACITSINMLGEELKSATISRNYFNNIFNSVTDMVFVLNMAGAIKDVNQSVCEQLKYDKEQIIGKSIEEICATGIRRLISILLKQADANNAFSSEIIYFKPSEGIRLPVHLNASWLVSNENKREGILLVAKNITGRLQAENRLIRAVIDTEEKERHRLARDLHDSLGQKLSAIKFYISVCVETVEDKSQRLSLKKCNEELASVLSEMREICFNLVPKTLKEFGILAAIKELCHEIARSNKIHFKIINENSLSNLPITVSIDIFRIIQEFITNAQRHGKATKIKMKFLKTENTLVVSLKDNGVGFIPNNVPAKSMGLQNVISRVKSHNGDIKISTVVGKGTEYFFALPLTDMYEQNEKK